MSQAEIGPRTRSNQHEQRPHRYAEDRSYRDASNGGAIASRYQVALDHGLIGCVLLSTEEEAVESQHGKRLLRQIPVGRAQTEFVVYPGDVENSRGTAGRQKQQITKR